MLTAVWKKGRIRQSGWRHCRATGRAVVSLEIGSRLSGKATSSLNLFRARLEIILEVPDGMYAVPTLMQNRALVVQIFM
jgi:hypothetical protein